MLIKIAILNVLQYEIHNFYRATLCYSTVYAVVICCSRVSVRLSFRPSACPSQAGIVPKRLNVGSCKQRRTTDSLGTVVFYANDLSKIQRGRTIEVR